ncbi:MAG: hypothetical protein KZQ85_10865 [Candidatus Thiodiazotropha sp. (ex Myrtea sp. 'scaly one' KF741663)]|nr:hypothetical protein [Candidatus Thiodiazotropha sp. (ex Myrtea sp. 'scaly one' KF741663)]
MVKYISLLIILIVSISKSSILLSADIDTDTSTDPGEALSADAIGGDSWENIDLRTGGVYFSVVDLNIPGNGGMDIEIRRAGGKNKDPNYDGIRSVGGWEIELPYIYGNSGRNDFCANPYYSSVLVQYGSKELTAYVSLPQGFWNQYEGLSSAYIDGIDRTTVPGEQLEIRERISKWDDRWGQYYFTIYQDYTPRPQYIKRPFYGLTMSIPGHNLRDLLKPEQNTVYSNYAYVTTDNWKVQCIAKDGVNNAGFLVFSPDGKKYTFDKSFIQSTGYIENWRQSSIFPIVSAENLHKPIHYYPSKVEDKHGNTLTYSYIQGSHNSLVLKTITSSENQLVTLNYVNNSLDNIQANDKTLQYYYEGYRSSLSEVVMPDGTSWKYSFDTTSNPYTYIVTSPYGGITTYKFNWLRADYFGGRENSKNISVLSAKSQSGPNVTTSKISYFYDKDTNGNNRTRVASYKGLEEFVFHNPNDWKMGAMLSSKSFDTDQDLSQINSASEINNNNLKQLQSVIYTWTPLLKVGETQARYSPVSKNYKKVLSNRTVNRNGTDYITNYSDYDDYGNPKHIEEANGTKSRVTDITYYNNPANWIIGFVENETTSGIGSVYRTLDPITGDMKVKNTFGTTEEYTYHSTGDLFEYTDQNGVITEFKNYKRGKPELINKSINKKGTHSVTQVITDNGEIESVTIAGKTTSYEYSGTGKITKITKPIVSADPIIINYAMQPTGYTQTIDKGTFNKTITYDGFGRTVLEDEEGIIRRSEYDKSGRLSKKYLPNSSEAEEYIYDALGRIVKAYPPTSNNEHTSYKYLVGNITEVTDTNGNVKTLGYQSYGDPNEQHLITIDAEEGVSLSIDRDLVGKITSVTQGTLTREYHYDTRQLLDYIINPESGTTDFDFDDAGNMLSKRHLSYPFIWYEYDGLNRLDFIDHPAGTDDIDYEYYEDGLLKTVTKGSTEWLYEYDDNSNLELEQFDTNINDPMNEVYFFYRSYNSKDHLIDLTYPSGSIVNYNPNDLGQPETVTPFISDVDYFPNGQVDKVKFANGVIADYTQDTSQRLQNINVNSPHVLLLTSKKYLYDYQNNVTDIIDNRNSLNTQSFLYDGVDRLTHVNGNLVLTYEPNGNIKTKNIGGKNLSYEYDIASNLLDNVKDNGTTYYDATNDPKGNMVSNGIDSFAYNSINQLVSVASKGIQYDYDGNGNRFDIQSTQHLHSIYSNNGHLLYENNLSTGKITEYYYLGDQLMAKNQECVDSDLDGDGLIDCIEARYGLNVNDSSDAVLDLDGDGLTNIREITLGLNPKNSDTDVDNIPDEYEVRYGLDAKVYDSDLDIDDDGLSNYEEYIHNTNPNLADTDGDGVSDGEEVALGTNPNFNVAVMVAINYLILN